MSDGIVHIGGDTVTVFGRYVRQRCAWCGKVLVEYDLERVAVPVGQEGPPATFPAGALVLVDGNMMTVVEPEMIAESPGVEIAKLPENACPHDPMTIPG